MSLVNNIEIIEAQEFTTTTGDNDNVELASSLLFVTCTSDNDRVTGLVLPIVMSGASCTVVNRSASNTLVIPDGDTGSTAGYRFSLGGASTLTLEPGQGQRFFLVSGTGWVPVRNGTFA